MNLNNPKPQAVNKYFFGGQGSLRKHAFMAGELGRTPSLSEPVTPVENAEITDKIEDLVNAAIDALDSVFGEVEKAFDYTTEDYGEFDSRSQTIGQAYEDLKGIREVVNGVIQGPGAPYVNDLVQALLDKLEQKSVLLENTIQDSPFPAMVPLEVVKSEEHLEEHLEPLKALARDAEETIVRIESADVAVQEPMEKDMGVGPILSLGILAAAAYGIYEFFITD